MPNNQRSHITGDGHQELQFLLFHKLATDPTTSHEAQFYYNTVDKTLLLYDFDMVGTGYKYIPKITQAFTPQQLVAGDGFFIKPIVAPVGTSFVLVDENATPSFVDITNVFAKDILNWDGTKYTPYNNRLVASPGYPYFYIGNDYPITEEVRLKLDGSFTAISVLTGLADDNYSTLSNNGFFHQYTTITNRYNIRLQTNNVSGGAILQAKNQLISSGVITSDKIYIGDTAAGAQGKGEYILIDDYNQLFDINMTTIKLSKGTANAWLTLNANKEIVYNVAPTHGNQAANGSLHAVATTTHAGFCPALPILSATGTYLRGDGTWAATSGINYWSRTGTTLSPLTANDIVSISSNSGSDILTVASTSVKGTAIGATGYTGLHLVGSDYGAVLESPKLALTILDTYATTNNTHVSLSIQRHPASNGADGMGSTIEWTNRNSTGSDYVTGYFINKLTLATSLSETSAFEWWLANGGAFSKKMVLLGSGTLDTLRGQYQYHAQTLGVDTAGDWRTFGNGTAFYTEYCTVGSITKGGGTWVVKNTIII